VARTQAAARQLGGTVRAAAQQVRQWQRDELQALSALRAILLIVEDPPQEMYDAQVYLHDTDILSFYMSSTGSRRRDLPGMLLLALAHAANNLGLPVPTLPL
jgi:hypothetical protein